ncbi:tRNA pseudouridine(55) synthase TruB [Candidatus Saccharibacteria bacterium]|nr:tRNA pseudouridine(55) synthase TruB [Candidatus Saccharibacteria bacterium]
MMKDDEILLIDKPAGMSSFGVVARVRRKLSEEAGHKVKVGHTGTLDPFATGLLILLTGKGTKRANEFLKLDKEYIATIRLGAKSTTGDIEGEIVENEVDRVEINKVKEVVKGFLGEIDQRVPSYSAVKINGQRAYKLARAGKEVEMPVRKVTIYNTEILDYKWPELKIRCEVSSGTYIRALGQDIGEKLGVGGYLTELRRTKVGKYKVEEAEKLFAK